MVLPQIRKKNEVLTLLQAKSVAATTQRGSQRTRPQLVGVAEPWRAAAGVRRP